MQTTSAMGLLFHFMFICCIGTHVCRLNKLSELVSHLTAGKGEDIDCKLVNPSAGMCDELEEDGKKRIGITM